MEIVTYVSLGFCACLLSLVIATAVFFWHILKSEEKRHEAERFELRKMIRDLQNRLSAKDLSSYFAIKAQEEPKPQKPRVETPAEDKFMDQAFMGFKG